MCIYLLFLYTATLLNVKPGSTACFLLPFCIYAVRGLAGWWLTADRWVLSLCMLAPDVFVCLVFDELFMVISKDELNCDCLLLCSHLLTANSVNFRIWFKEHKLLFKLHWHFWVTVFQLFDAGISCKFFIFSVVFSYLI